MLSSHQPSDPIARELSALASVVRAAGRAPDDEANALQRALDLKETHHGNGTVTYHLCPGRASNDEALQAYSVISRKYPGVLEALMRAARTRAANITIEITPVQTQAPSPASHHELVTLMPRILARFRGKTQT